MVKTKQIGSIGWEDGDLGNGSFMKLEEGSNVVRILTNPYQFYTHWTQDESGQQKNVRCSTENCPVCERGERAKARWYVGVLNRKTGKPMVLEMGIQIFKAIKGLKAKKAWGDPRTFDADIERFPKGSQPLYQVTPEAKAPLSKEEIAIVKQFIEDTDFEALTEPATPQKIREDLGLADDFGSDDDDLDNTPDVEDDVVADNDDDDDSDFTFE